MARFLRIRFTPVDKGSTRFCPMLSHYSAHNTFVFPSRWSESMLIASAKRREPSLPSGAGKNAEIHHKKNVNVG